MSSDQGDYTHILIYASIFLHNSIDLFSPSAIIALFVKENTKIHVAKLGVYIRHSS